MNNSKSRDILKTMGLVAVVIAIYKGMIIITELIVTPIYEKVGWIELGEKMGIGDKFTAPNIIAYGFAVLLAAVGYTLILRRKNAKIMEYCSLNVISPKYVIFAGLFGFCVNCTGMSAMIANQANKTLGSIYQSYLEMGDDKTVMFIFVGLIIPIFEELMYRGLAYNLLKERMNFKIAIVIQGVLFLVFEVLSGGPMNLFEVSYGFIMAVIFAFFYEWTGSLWTTISARSLKNLASLIIITFIPQRIFVENGYVFMIISAVLCVVTFMAVMKSKKEEVKLIEIVKYKKKSIGKVQ